MIRMKRAAHLGILSNVTPTQVFRGKIGIWAGPRFCKANQLPIVGRGVDAVRAAPFWGHDGGCLPTEHRVARYVMPLPPRLQRRIFNIFYR